MHFITVIDFMKTSSNKGYTLCILDSWIQIKNNPTQHKFKIPPISISWCWEVLSFQNSKIGNEGKVGKLAIKKNRGTLCYGQTSVAFKVQRWVLEELWVHLMHFRLLIWTKDAKHFFYLCSSNGNSSNEHLCTYTCHKSTL
jgi:hypothetical protein